MSLFDLVGDILFGSLERGGFAEAAGSLFTHFFNSGGIGGATRAAAGESAFYTATGWFNTASDMFWQYQMWKDFGGTGGEEAWKSIPPAEKRIIELATEGAKSHSFILQQAKANNINPEYVKKYQTLGLELPSADLLKDMQRRLNKALHPDHNQVDRALFQNLTEAVENLQNPEIIDAYTKLRTERPEELQKIFDKMVGVDLRKVYEEAEKAARLKIGYNGVSPTFSKMEMAAAKLSNIQKAGIVFATVTGVSLLSYGIAKLMEKRNRRDASEDVEEINAPKHAAMGALNGAISGTLLSVGASAAMTYAKQHGAEVANMGRLVMKNVTGVHYFPVVAGITAMSGLGAAVRYKRAHTYNDSTIAQSHTQRLQAGHTNATERTH